jgi:crotonobetainyl-CoA:carnitine CoA-transferase CaiB-like acyl-CoA transferase
VTTQEAPVSSVHGVRPVDGLRIIDMSRHMAGPYAAAMLTDYGASVIKVESAPHGDPSRRTGVHSVGDESAMYLAWNRGKRSISVDLHTPEGLEIVRRLAKTSDVLLENYRPGVAEEIGLDYESLVKDNPRLIYCSVTGFGPIGPLATYPATDPIIQAMSGVMSATGPAGGEPMFCGIPIADYVGSLFAVQGILYAVLAREKTGRGQKVDVSLLMGLMSGLSTRLASYWATGKEPERFGSAHSVSVPYQAFETADGYAVAGVFGPGDWPKLCNAIERSDLIDDPRFVTNQSRYDNRHVLSPILESVFRTRPTSEWAARLKKSGNVFGPIQNFTELFANPQVEAMGVLQKVSHTTLGELPQLGPAISMSDTPGWIGAGPPILGEHSEDVLVELGYEKDEIASFEAAGIVVAARQVNRTPERES